uniref:Extended FMRFamide-2 n=1 Tax=Mantophasma kudubergense TaxID=1037657 RepID=FAR2_MANKU|nr:RecName: Full=Extended FMRFamide-2; Short=FMRFa-2 [Mantophasma kudubergense]
ADYLQLARA